MGKPNLSHQRRFVLIEFVMNLVCELHKWNGICSEAIAHQMQMNENVFLL